uniref:G_PROTEIN_RECEP_F1_2 domain-containing protein n=1 Tax=Macrostomum lignano TaxID=282301 RepID=A0A1I8JPB5_9PLAT
MYIASTPVLWFCYIFSLLLLLLGLFMMLRPAIHLSPLNPVSMLVNSFPACNIRMFITYSAIMVSVYIIVFFSIERALVLVNPFRWSRWLTLRKARIAVACLVVSSCLLSSPALFSFRRYVVNHPSRLYRNDTGETVYSDELLSNAKCDFDTNQTDGGVGGSVSETVFVDGNNGTQPTHSHFGFVYPGEAEQPHSGLLSELATPPSFKRSNASRSRSASAAFANISGLLGKAEPADLSTAPHSLLPPGIGLDCQPVAASTSPCSNRSPVFHVLSLSVVPFFVTGVCNLVILFVLRRRGDGHDLRKASSSGQQSDEQIDRQVTKRLILVSTTYILLSFPLALFHIVTHAMSGTYCYVWAANALTITLTLNFVNFSVNFVIYCISEEQFRRLLASLLHCRQKNFTRMLSYVTRPRQHRHRPGGRPAGAGGGVGGTTGPPRIDNTPAVAVRNAKTAGTGGSGTSSTALDSKPKKSNCDRRLRCRRLTDVLVHREAAAASHDVDNEGDSEASEEHNFRNCSLLPEEDDWPSSQQFSRGRRKRLREGLRSDGQCKGNHGQMEPSAA